MPEWGLPSSKFRGENGEACLVLHWHSQPRCFVNCMFREAWCPLHKPCLAADKGLEKNLEKGLDVRWRRLEQRSQGREPLGFPNEQSQDEAKAGEKSPVTKGLL